MSEKPVTHIVLFEYNSQESNKPMKAYQLINNEVNTEIKNIIDQYFGVIDLKSVKVFTCQRCRVSIETNIEVEVY